MRRRLYRVGTIVRNFKRETIINKKNEYLYQIIDYGILTTDKSKVVIYRALYGTCEVYVRPLKEFMCEVDKNKYPNIKQKYCFEKMIGD